MAAAYTLDTFAPHVGTDFTVTEVEGGFTIQLADAAASQAHDGQPRQDPFTLTFTGAPDVVLPQRTYTLEHGELGRVEIFLVPIGPEKPGAPMRYEAVFN